MDTQASCTGALPRQDLSITLDDGESARPPAVSVTPTMPDVDDGMNGHVSLTAEQSCKRSDDRHSIA